MECYCINATLLFNFISVSGGHALWNYAETEHACRHSQRHIQYSWFSFSVINLKLT